MFYERDIYPGLGGASTRNKSLLTEEKQGGLHKGTGGATARSIWVSIGAILAIIFLLGYFNR